MTDALDALVIADQAKWNCQALDAWQLDAEALRRNTESTAIRGSNEPEPRLSGYGRRFRLLSRHRTRRRT